jgi:Domain of unknown function (DUF4832)/Beta-galactosidase
MHYRSQKVNKFRNPWLRVCLAVVLIAFLAIFVLKEVGDHAPGQSIKNLATKIGYRVINPKTSSDIILNPGKGWVLYGLPSDHSANVIASASVGYMRYDWSSIEPVQGLYNWSVIDYAIKVWQAQGKQFAFGVMNADSSDYSVQYVTPRWVFADGAQSVRSQTFDNILGKTGIQYEPVWNDPVFLQKLKDFVTALAQRYDNNPNIAYIDVRSYGNWGEQHVYGIPPSIALSPADVQKHIQLYADAFKHVQIIVPWGASNYSSVYNWAVDNKVGMRRDGLMVDSDGSELTRANGHAPSIFEFYASYQWLLQNGYWSDAKLRNDVIKGKPSYIGMGQWGNDADMMLANNEALIHDLANQMGYYFVLKSATIPTAISNSQSFHMSLSWNNQGVTYLYGSCRVAIALLDSSGNVVQRRWFTSSNPQTWAPGQTKQENTAITFTGVRAGTYKLAVGLFQNESDSNPIYKIGNQGRTANGWYVLSSGVAIS